MPRSTSSPFNIAELIACRESAALFDETSFAKIEISCDGAAGFPEHPCDNRASHATVDAITYTQVVDPRSGIERDFTVTRLSHEVPHCHPDRLEPAPSRVDPRIRQATALWRTQT